MHKNKYCYPNSDVLINKLNIKNEKSFAKAEIKLTYIRVQELEKNNPIKGNFDFEHLKRDSSLYISGYLRLGWKRKNC